MKSRFTFVIILLAGTLLTGCSKLPYGPVSNEGESIVLTENNFVFEGDLYKYALTVEIDSLQQREKELLGLVGQDPKLQAELDATRTLMKQKIALESGVLAFEDIIDQIGRRIPNVPRPPRPSLLPDGLQYIIRYDLESLSMIGYNSNSELVIKSEEGYLSPLAGTKGLIQIQEVDIFDLMAEDIVTLKIARKDNKGNIAEYSLDAKVQK